MKERKPDEIELSAPADGEKAEPPKRDAKKYRAGKWLGHVSYHCERCVFGTLDQAEIEEHVQRPHAALTKTEG